MINFPAWVDTPKRQSKQQLASKRLKFLLCNAALQHTGRGNIAAFAETIGLEMTTVHLYVKKGALSRPAAETAEEIFGRKLIRAEWLTDPLSMKVD